MRVETHKAVWHPLIEQSGSCEAQLGVIIPNFYFADARGLLLQKDKLHLTTEAQVQLNKILADVCETIGFLKRVTWW